MSYTVYEIGSNLSLPFNNKYFEKIPLVARGRSGASWDSYRLAFKSVGTQLVGGIQQSAIIVPRFDWASARQHIYFAATYDGYTEEDNPNNQVTGVPVEIYTPTEMLAWPIDIELPPSGGGVKNYIDYTEEIKSTLFIRHVFGESPSLNSDYDGSPAGTYNSSYLTITPKTVFVYVPSRMDTEHSLFVSTYTPPTSPSDVTATSKHVLTVDDGYIFNGWKTTQEGTTPYEFPEGVIVSEDGMTIEYPWGLLTGNVTIWADVSIESYALVANTYLDFGGTVTIETDPDDGEKYTFNSIVSIYATSDSGFKLSGWILIEGGVTTNILEGEEGFSNPIEVVMDSDKEITAVFSEIVYDIKIDTPLIGKGSIERKVYSPEGDSEYPVGGVVAGTVVKLTASVIDGNNDYFAGWYLKQTDVKVDSGEVFLVTVREDMEYVAKFGGTATVTVPVQRIGQDPGAELINASAGVSPPAPANLLPASTYQFVYGEPVRLIAVSGEHAIFSGWYDIYTASYQSAQRTDLTEDCEFSPTDSFTITAVFSYSSMKNYIKMTNSGADSYGVLLLSSGNVFREISSAEFSSSLDDRYGVVGGMGTLNPELPDMQTGTDRFVELDGSGQCTIRVSLLIEGTVLFSRWMIAQVIPKTGGGYEVSTKTDLSSNNPTTINVFSDCVIYAEYTSSDPSKIIVNYDSGSDRSMGEISISPIGQNFLKGPPIQGDYFFGNSISVIANPANGYKLDGWYSSEGALISSDTEYTFTVESGGSLITLLARFEQDSNAIYEWEGDTTRNKLLEWESKRFKSSVPFNPVCTRVYADKYADTTKLKVRSGTSPEVDGNSREAVIVIRSQDVRRLPIMRPEKYTSVEIQSASTVTEISVSTSMEGLLNG